MHFHGAWPTLRYHRFPGGQAGVRRVVRKGALPCLRGNGLASPSCCQLASVTKRRSWRTSDSSAGKPSSLTEPVKAAGMTPHVAQLESDEAIGRAVGGPEGFPIKEIVCCLDIVGSACASLKTEA